MTTIDELLSEVRFRLDQITHHINQLPPVETLTDETYVKLLHMLKQANERLSIFVESLPKSYMPDAEDNITSEILRMMRFDIRSVLAILITVASLIHERYKDQLSSAQYESVHAIKTISDELVDYLNTFDL